MTKTVKQIFFPKIQMAGTKEEPKVKRVAVYARVSTTLEEQQTSLIGQKDYYTQLINSRIDYTLAGIYADDGISGTSWKHRGGFKKMMEDARNGQLDIIMTKSISRFARNTVDSVVAIRKLQAWGVAVYFEKENIWTNDSKGEFLLTLMSSLAQEESRSISENTKWGKRKRFAMGFYSSPYSHFLGYDQAGHCQMVVNKKEARTVRKIYKLFLEGLTPHSIALILTEQKIKAPAGGDKWHSGVVSHILSNEKYKGDALLQKRVCIDFLTKKSVENKGQLPKYYVTGGHEAIIAPEVFDYVQTLRKERMSAKNRYSGQTIYSSKFLCGHCGASYSPKIEHSNDKYRRVIWMCYKRFDFDICGIRNTRIPEKSLPDVFAAIARTALKKHPKAFALCRISLGWRKFPRKIIKTRMAADMEDLAIIIKTVVVYPGGRLKAVLINGKTYQVEIN